MNLNEIIRQRRQAMGLTQEGLAERLGVSAPAVNKWERGLNYPDITLLPTLARTLGVDLNTLLSFQENLTQEEIGQFLNALYETSRQEGAPAAFRMAREKLREFPNSDNLAYSVAGLLEGILVLQPEEPGEEREKLEGEIAALYERCVGSADPRVAEWATYTLASRCIGQGELERGEALLERLFHSLTVPWDLSQSPLYAHLPTKEAAGECQAVLLQPMLEQVEQDPDCAFLRAEPGWEELRRRYSKN